MIQKLNSLARMDVVSRSYGYAIGTMIAVMTVMNQHTCAAKETAQRDGNDVQDNRTIDASRNGYSVMGKMVTIQQDIIIAIVFEQF